MVLDQCASEDEDLAALQSDILADRYLKEND